MVKVKPNVDGSVQDLSTLIDFVTRQFPGAWLKDAHYGELHFHVS